MMRIDFGDWSMVDPTSNRLKDALRRLRYDTMTDSDSLLVAAALQDFLDVMNHPTMTVNEKLNKFRAVLRRKSDGRQDHTESV